MAVIDITQFDVECSRCGTEDSEKLTPVWESAERREQEKKPKFVGCIDCHYMTEIENGS